MENTELMKPQAAEMLEKVVVDGDLSKLTSAQRLDYYRQVCQSCGLNPLTKPFDYIRLNGKLTLYARKDATDQLRKIHGVSIDECSREYQDDLIIVTAKGHDDTGRTDVEIGAVSRKDMQGNFANALMKANTKAKRRLTLSLCGLGWLDESEVDSIPASQAQAVVVDDNGEIMGEIEAKKVLTIDQKSEPETQENAVRFDEAGFLRDWKHKAGLPPMTLSEAVLYKTTKGKAFGICTVEELSYMWRAYQKRIENPNNSAETKEDASFKMSAINEILTQKASSQADLDAMPDPIVTN